MNDNRYYSPEARTIRSLCQKLSQECLRADQAEANEEMYRLAFQYLNRQPWFQEHNHKLHDYIDRVLEARKEDLTT